MISINRQYCYGCGACVQRCPKGCIIMTADKSDGFLYPEKAPDSSGCVNCGLCEKACPLNNDIVTPNITEVYSFQHKNHKILKKSSSGGVFSSLSEVVLSQGGVVFGSRFTDDWQVTIDYTLSQEGLEAFRGSKYVQATTGTSYKDAKSFLERGKCVLFSGTPCQIAGLKSFLGKNYDNLLTLDVVCHGVPSPLAWSSYLYECGHIDSINFRDKSTGWENYSVRIGDTSTLYTENTYMSAFLSNLDLRRCCSECKYKAGRSGSDITIGDFWGIDKLMPIDDDKGISCIVPNTIKGIKVISSLSTTRSFKTAEALRYNISYSQPTKHHINRELFFALLMKSGFSKAYKIAMSKSPIFRILRKTYRLINK